MRKRISRKRAASGEQSGTTWSPKLARGRTYIWQVTATRDGERITAPRRPAPNAKFKVLSQVEFDKIARARRSRPDQHLVLGLLYAKAGLLTEALGEFEALARANPKSSLPAKYIAKVKREMNLKK